MAATIAKCWGEDATRTKEAHRLGSRAARAQAATWHTFADACVMWDGSGYVEVKQNGKVIHRFDFKAE